MSTSETLNAAVAKVMGWKGRWMCYADGQGKKPCLDATDGNTPTHDTACVHLRGANCAAKDCRWRSAEKLPDYSGDAAVALDALTEFCTTENLHWRAGDARDGCFWVDVSRLYDGLMTTGSGVARTLARAVCLAILEASGVPTKKWVDK